MHELTLEEHRLIWESASNTRLGRLLRSVWQPIALVDDIPPAGSITTTIMHERLEIARNVAGLPVLVAPAYPTFQAAGVFFGFFGKGAQPPFPDYDVFDAPSGNVFATKFYYESNAIVDLESNVDPAHVSILHIQFPESEARGTYPPMRKMGITGTDLSANAIYAIPGTYAIAVADSPAGFRITARKPAGPGRAFVRSFEFIAPNIVTAAVVEDGYVLMYHVPIDDDRHWRFDIQLDRRHPIDKDAAIQRLATTRTPDYRPNRNRTNRYLQDRALMSDWYAGMGTFPPDHDAFAFETSWPLDRRIHEHLGAQDVGVIGLRRNILALLAAPETFVQPAAGSHLTAYSRVVEDGSPDLGGTS